MKWYIEKRASVWAVVDETGQDVTYIDLAPASHNGEPCGSVTSRDRTPEELRKIACVIAAAPELLKAAKDVIDDLERYAGRCDPGPDKRLAELRRIIAMAV